MAAGRDPSAHDEASAVEHEWLSPFIRPGSRGSGSAGVTFGRYRGLGAFLALPWAESGETMAGESDETGELEDETEVVDALEAYEELVGVGEEAEEDTAETAWDEASEQEEEVDGESTSVNTEDWMATGLQEEGAPFDSEALADPVDEELGWNAEQSSEDEAETELDDGEAEWEDEEGPGWASELEDEETETSTGGGPVAAGTVTIAKVPLLRRHAGVGPDLILAWNDMREPPRTVDVVVHLHGYSLTAGSRLDIERDVLRRSGLDWADPARVDPAPGRTRPTLALLPRGHFFGGKTGRGYIFPALTAHGGLRQLVDFGLRQLAERLGVGNLALDRLILTAHSGGGASLLRMVRSVDPHEVHVFDGLYQSATTLLEWASSRIARDRAALAREETSVEDYMGRRGGALRVLFRAGTARYSRPLARALSAPLEPDGRLRRWYRVEPTVTDHVGIPPRYGWRLLADAGADLPDVPARPAGKPATATGQRVRREAFEEETGTGPGLRSRIVRVATDAWNAWGRGTKKERDPDMTDVLQQYYKVGVGRDVSASDLRNASWQYKHPWSAVFISYVMRQAGAGDAFTYAPLHATYACAAKRAREAESPGKFWAYRIDEARPEVGDLVCKDRIGKTKRCSGTTYDTLCAGGSSHCDVVVAVDSSKNQIRTIGGNVNQSVDDKVITLDASGRLPERARDGCRWIAVIKPPDGPTAVAGGTSSLLGNLPGRLADAVRQGAVSMQVALAIMTGQRDANTLTNLVFYAKHPEFPVGYKIQPNERQLAKQWADIKERVIVPLLRALGTSAGPARVPAGPSPTVSSPATPPRGSAPSAADDRAYRHHPKLGGYSRYGGGRLDTRLRELRDQGKLSIADADIELLQRISQVETGGCVQGLNSWDDVYMSIGFMQWPMVFGKLQRLIARAPEAFRRYGIELDPPRRYSIRRASGPETPLAVKGVDHPQELRSLAWARRFYAAGLDPEIVAREAELALEVIAEERRMIEKSLRRPIPHYDESSALRALIQETNNHRPAWLKEALKRAVARYPGSGAPSTARFLELVRTSIRSVYPEKAKAAAGARTKDPKKIADAVARMARSAENLITKTATVHVKGRCG